MASQAQAELYLRLRAAGIGDASRELSGLARTATAAGREFRALQEEAGAGQLYRKIAREAATATAELTRLQRVTREGRTSVFFSDLTGHLQGAGRIGATAFTALTAGIGGFVTAGMQGTAEAIQLRTALQEISFQVASVFTPQIHKTIDAVQSLANWLRNMTGEQQESARQWVAGALALSGFLALLPRVTAGLALLTRVRGAAALGGTAAAVGAAGAGTAAATAAGGSGIAAASRGLLGRFGGVAAGFALLGATQEGRDAMVALSKATAPLVSAFAQLAPLVGRLAGVVAGAVNWIVENVPGLKSESPLANLGGLAGGIAGYRYGGAAGGAAGFLAGKALTAGLEEALGPGRAMAEEAAKTAVQSIEAAKKQLAGFKAELAAGGLSDARREKLEGYVKQLEAGIAGKEGKAKDQLTPFSPGFESPADLYRRIAEVASGQNDPAKETADNTKAIADTMRQLIETLRATGLHVPLDRKGDA